MKSQEQSVEIKVSSQLCRKRSPIKDGPDVISGIKLLFDAHKLMYYGNTRWSQRLAKTHIYGAKLTSVTLKKY